eukprot:8525036-Pyramimonas_sp.AAC.1
MVDGRCSENRPPAGAGRLPHGSAAEKSSFSWPKLRCQRPGRLTKVGSSTAGALCQTCLCGPERLDGP